MADESITDLVKKNDDGSLRTTSVIVAERFGKDHKNVLQAVENLECSQEFRELNFQLSYYLSRQGKTMPMVEMTRDGFMFLAMGFTGREAAQWKEHFIHAFNKLEVLVREQAYQRFALPPDLLELHKQTEQALAAMATSHLEFQSKISSRFDRVSEHFDSVSERFDQVDTRMASIEDVIKGIVRRRPFGVSVQREWNGVIVMRYKGLCPCCHSVEIVDAFGRPIAGVYEADHWYQPSKNGVSQGWPVCSTCNHGVLEIDRNSKQAAFDHFHQFRKSIYKRSDKRIEQVHMPLDEVAA